MFKYVYYASLLMAQLAMKLPGIVLVYAAIPFRARARNAVYNYHLRRGHARHLKRLRERRPEKLPAGWKLHDIHAVGFTGFVAERPITKLQYYLWLCVWVWLDDDSNHDTYDAGHIRNHHIDNHSIWVGSALRAYLSDFLAKDKPTYGNTFDLGDKRSWWPSYNWLCVLIWTTRNTAYNFKYLNCQQMETSLTSWYWSRYGLEFGWKPDGTVQGINYRSLVWGLK